MKLILGTCEVYYRRDLKKFLLKIIQKILNTSRTNVLIIHVMTNSNSVQPSKRDFFVLLKGLLHLYKNEFGISSIIRLYKLSQFSFIQFLDQ